MDYWIGILVGLVFGWLLTALSYKRTIYKMKEKELNDKLDRVYDKLGTKRNED